MYRVQLQNFEGPLDLLLFFIKRDELDIHDIPISYITQQFLEYIHLLEELDLDVASEFIYMASVLMAIKAKMMLPREGFDEEEVFDEHDPRYELVQQLLQYKRFKEMGEKMGDMDEFAQRKLPRKNFETDQVIPHQTGESLKDVTLFDLMSAYQRVLLNVKRQRITHNVENIMYTIEKQAEFVLDLLQRVGRSSFVALCSEMVNRTQVVVTFLAVLEMIKEQQIQLLLEDDPTDFHIDLRPIEEIYGVKT